VLATNEPLVRPYVEGKYTGMLLKHRWWFPEYETYKHFVERGLALGTYRET
jgi:hypothetical protein